MPGQTDIYSNRHRLVSRVYIHILPRSITILYLVKQEYELACSNLRRMGRRRSGVCILYRLYMWKSGARKLGMDTVKNLCVRFIDERVFLLVLFGTV